MRPIDPRVVALQARVFAHRLDVRKVISRAKVARGTWWRWTAREVDPKTDTILKISAVIDEMIAEQTPIPEDQPHG